MKIQGKIFEVTNLESFALSYILNPSKPKAGTFKAAANIQVQLGSVIPSFGIGFFPGISLKSKSTTDGSFSFSISNEQLALLKNNKFAYFVAYRQTGTVNMLGQNIPIYEPVYRSEAFDITKTNFSDALNLYFAPYTVPDSAGISQSTVDSQIKSAKKKFKDIDKLSATIGNGEIKVSGSGRGAEIKFDIDLGVSTSSNLSSFIKGKVENLDIDLPGPDIIVGICVSKDDIAKEVDEGIAAIMKEANKTIETTLITEVANATGQSKTIVETLFKTSATVTFRSLSYPVVGTKKFKIPGFNEIQIPIKAVVPKVAVGFPRKIK